MNNRRYAALLSLCLAVLGAWHLILSPQWAAAQSALAGIYLRSAERLSVTYQGDAAAVRPLVSRQAAPVSLASDDFNSDGIGDLVVGYSTADGGRLAISLGNLDAFAPQSQATFDGLQHEVFPSPYRAEARVIAIPNRPDFVATGNFVSGLQNDLVTAARGATSFTVLTGRGDGQFDVQQPVTVPGTITALSASRLDAGQFSQLVVGVRTQAGPMVLVYTGSFDGFSLAERYPVTADATSFEFGHLDGNQRADVLILSGGPLSILHGASHTVDTVPVAFPVSSAATGHFVFDRGGSLQMALLAGDGSVHILARSTLDARPYSPEENRARFANRFGRAPEGSAGPVVSAATPPEAWTEVERHDAVAVPTASSLLFRTRISSNGADDVMVLDGSRLSVLAHPNLSRTALSTGGGINTVSARGGVITRSEPAGAGSVIAALSLRVNVDGRPGVVLLRRDEIVPLVMMPLPDPTFTVNTTNDTVDNNLNDGICADSAGHCSLRAAVMQANHDNANDTITVPAGTYTLTLTGPDKSIAGTGNDTYGSLDIFAGVTITGAVDGSGNPTTIVQAGSTSSNGIDRVFAVNPGLNNGFDVHFSNLEIRFGKDPYSCPATAFGCGGGVFFEGSGTGNMSCTNCNIHDNQTTDGDGGGITVDQGGVTAATGVFTLTGSTVQNNTAKESTSGGPGIGGGIFVGSSSPISVSSSKFLNNNANNVVAGNGGEGGGLFLFNPSSTAVQSVIHASTISGNKAGDSTGEGGGIFTGQGLIIDQGTIISNNTAGEGGGLWSSLNAETTTLTKVTITGNTANGTGDPAAGISGGGGIFSSSNGATSSHLVMHFSRLAGNSAAPSGFGSNLESQGTSASTANVTNNWWGTNAAAGTIHDAHGSVTFDPFIVLTHTASPQKIRINQSSTLTGDLSKDNHGTAIGLSNLDEIIALPITFDSPVLGTIPQSQPEVLNGNAQATATFIAGVTSGLGSAHATVDQAVVSVNSNLVASATEVGTTATITTVGAHGFSSGEFVSISGVGVGGYNGSFFLILSTPTSTTFTYTAGSSGLGASSGGTANAGIIILQPPTITKSFNPTTVATSISSTITFSITNGNVVPINGSFTDTLPAGLVVAATPAVVNNCGGSVTAVAGSGSITFSNAASLAVGTCTITVNVSSAIDNIYSNSVTIDSTDAGTGNTSSVSLTVINPPHSAKAFGAATIPLNGTTTFTITLNSTNANLTVNGVAFTDNLPAGLVVATPNSLNSTCSGTATGVSGSGSVSLSGASLAPGASCTVAVSVQGTTAGVKNNSLQASSTNAGSGNTSNASITVVAPPTISKAFAPATVSLGVSSTITFTISNPNATVALSGIGFSDSLPSGLVVASTPNVLNNCVGTVTATAGAGVISLSGGQVVVSGGCAVSVDVTAATAGSFSNTTGTITSTEGGTGATSNTAVLTVVAPPTISKAFGSSFVPVNGTTTLAFTITNPAANTVAESGVSFGDLLPAGLLVAGTPGVVNTCGGSVTATASTASISLSGATVSVNSNCTVTVNVTGTTTGLKSNVTGAISSTNGGSGTTSNTATITVTSPPTISKAFTLSQIPLNGSTALTFTITNPNAGVALSSVAFSDTLPAGLVVSASPGVSSTCGGTFTANPGAGSVSLSGGAIATGAFCTVSVSITGTTSGVKNNTSGAVTSTEGGTGVASNTATITVLAPPTISKAFAPTSIPLSGTSTVTFLIANPNSTVGLTAVAFSDSLPAGMVVATPNNVVASGCGSPTVTATAGTGTISLSAASIVASGSCTLSVDVTGTTAGTKSNTTGAVSSTEGGTGTTSNTATLSVIAPPTITKVFTPATIPLNGTTTMTFAVTNPASNLVAAAGVAFSDTLPTGLVVATPNGLTNTCSGTATAVAGSTSITLTGGSIATNSFCTVTVNVTGTASGQYTNTTGAVSSTNGGTGNTSNTANLTVANPPTISKLFGALTIPVGGSTSLTFNINNPNTNVTLNGVAFTDSLPAGLVVAGPNGLAGSCGGGTITAVPASGTISLAGATLASSTGCTFAVNVTGTIGGIKNNSVQVTSTEGGAGNTSNSSITVVAPPAIQKAFGAASIPLNGSTSLTFTLTNPNLSVGLTNIAFSDTLPTGNATLLVATPNGFVDGPPACGGTITATQATGSITVTGVNLAPGGSCTFVVNVTGTLEGVANNSTSNVTSAEGGTGLTATASINVVAPPTVAKAFGATGIPLSGSTSLTFVITNPTTNTVAQSGIAFSDTFPAGLVVATPNGLTNTCGGSVTAVAASNSVVLSGGTLPVPPSSCTITLNVTGTTAGPVANTTGAVSSTNGGTGATSNTATMTVAAPPATTKSFGAALIPVGGTTTLTVTINNPNLAVAYTGLSFTDNLPAGLVVASPNGLVAGCGGVVTASPGTGQVILSAGTLPANTPCSIVVNVLATTGGIKSNSVQTTANESGAGNTSTAGITVVAPPVLIKAFGVASIPRNGSTSLTFTLTNPNGTVGLTGVGFTDTLPTGNATLVVATPNGFVNGGSPCNGTITAVQASGTVTVSGATLAAGASCSFAINVTGTLEGSAVNTTGNISSVEGGTGGTATASLTVVAPPTVSKAFGASGVPLGGSTSLTFVITNPATNTAAENGIAFSDTLTNGLVVATPNGLTNTCGGTATAVAGSTSVTLSNGTIAAAGSSCTVTINVTGTTAGTVSNTTSAISSTNGGTGATSNTATLSVAAPPVISKAFGASAIPLSGTTTLTFNINNPNAAVSYTGLAFTDNLPAGLVVANPNGLAGVCGGIVTASPGTGQVSLSAGTLPASSNCSIVVNVMGTSAGIKNNSVQIAANESGPGNTSSASITVVAPPVIIKAFGAATIPLNGSTSLTFTLQNNNSTVALTGIGFTDTLPSGAGAVLVSTPNGFVNGVPACNGTITAAQATGVVSVSGATLAANSACSFSINVTGTAAGLATNTTGNVTSTEGGTGGTATASVTVLAPPAIAKAFLPTNIILGGTSSLTFTITNPNTTVALTGVGFTDTLPTGVTVVSSSNSSCGGTVTTTAPVTIALSGATVANGTPCTFSITVTGATAGVKNNTTGSVTSTNGGTGGTASATLTVAAAPTVSKAFGAASVLLNASTSLTFALTNPNTTVPLTGVAFSDSLPAGLQVASPNGLSTNCAGTVTAVAGSGSVSFSAGSMAASTTCTIAVSVTGVAIGVDNNTTGVISATESGAGTTSNTASITVIGPPSIGKVFGAAAINLGSTTSLTFTLNNPNATVGLTGVAFTDTLPAGLVVATPNGLSGSCGGGTITATAGSGSVSLSGAALGTSASCTFAVNITGVGGGHNVNTTGNVTATNGGSGSPATASIDILAPDTAISKTHVGNFIRGVAGQNYTITVSNVGFGPTVGTVTVVDTLPAVNHTLVPTAMSGTGWACVLPTLTCTRGDALPSGTSYPAITLTVDVPQNIQANVTNTATVSGGGDVNPANNTATDPTHISPGAPFSITAFAGTPQTLVDTGGTSPFQALVVDAGGFGVPGLTVTFTASGGGTFQGDGVSATAITDQDGIATSPAFSISGAVGTFTISASVPGVGTPAKFTLAVIHSNLVISPSALLFTYSVGDPTPVPAQTIGITADVPFALTTSVSPANSWLVATGSGNAVTVSVNTAGLTKAQTLLGSVILNLNNGAIINVPVTLTVVGPPVLVASPASLTFSAVAGQGAPPSQTVLVGAQNRNVDFAVSTSAPWITVTASRNTTPGQLTVSVDPNDPAVKAGGTSFTGSIQVTSSAASNSPLTIPVTLTLTPGPVIASGGILNSASLLAGTGAPNTIMSLFGTFTCSAAPTVQVNNQPVEIIGYTAGQINFTLPGNIGGQSSVAVTVSCNGQTSSPLNLPITPAAPGIFTSLMTGTGEGAILNSDSTVNSPANPEPRKYLAIYGTGFGAYLDPGADGLQHTALDVQAFIGEKPAQVLFAGHAPGYTLGLQQINVLVPADAPSGPTVSLRLRINGVDSQPGVTVAIQ